MAKSVKKHDYLLPFARLFTRGEPDIYGALLFRSAESFGDEESPALAAPATWSVEAINLLAAAAHPAAPAELVSIEENTVPSWLWRHRPVGMRKASEGDARSLIDRVAGSAAALGWKETLFGNEKQARAFYDETRYALIHRQIALDPALMRGMGLEWAYGIGGGAQAVSASAPRQAEISNAAIDALLGKGKAPTASLKKLFAARGKGESRIDLRLSDVAADWHSASSNPARAAIDLMALRHNDGSVNIDALRQTTRLLAVLLDLQGHNDVTVGLANLAPLLLALGLGYDSEAGRALAASLAALVTAEAYAASAEMASLRGPSAAFNEERECIMRALRNHRRAVYGDTNDYEHLSVLPAPLPLKNCPDLALAAEAQRRWDEALDLARAFGLRATQVTDMTPSPVLAMLMESASQGLEPMQALTCLRPDANDMYRAELHPSVAEALARLTYPRAALHEATLHIAGARSLRKAPAINAATLRARGIDDNAFEKIDAYLPCVNNVRFAVTPWIIGMEHCRKTLKIAPRLLDAPNFDLLKHLGFDDAAIAAANAYAYVHASARAAKIIHLRHRPLFACGNEVSAEARLRMAASVQSFISGDTGVTARLPASQSAESGAEMTLAAWRRGLKSLTLVFDPALTEKTASTSTARRIKPASQPHATPMKLQRRSRNGKSATSSTSHKTTERRARSH
ncbi:MAG: hypothetical protein P4M15_01695 [Alphaproteobacteria bacterium]|nr:hypothetical protein [Alphaproteobacteria bacterium]